MFKIERQLTNAHDIPGEFASLVDRFHLSTFSLAHPCFHKPIGKAFLLAFVPKMAYLRYDRHVEFRLNVQYE